MLKWKRIIDFLCGFPECKLFLITSNSGIISPELEAVANGKYDVIDVLPLSLYEYIDFHGLEEITPEGTKIMERRYRGKSGDEYSFEDIFELYTTYGALAIMNTDFMDRERVRVILDGTYSAIVLRDIIEIGERLNEDSISDPALLRNIIKILLGGIGRNISATGVKKYLADNMDKRAATKTVEQYMRATVNAHLFYTASRYDIRAGKVLKTLARYYVFDPGIHNYIMDVDEEMSRISENNVFFELLRRDYEVYNGKIGSEKIDFIAVKGNKKVYIQAEYNLNDKNREELLHPLRRVRDNHLKVLLAFNAETSMTADGIVIMNAFEFLMGRPLAL